MFIVLGKVVFEFCYNILASWVKSLPVSAGAAGDTGSILGSGISPRGRNRKYSPVFLPGKFHR